MAKRKHLLPFGWAPGHWGMAGKTRELAQAEYELEGEELARRKVDINIAEHTKKEVKLARLKLDLKFHDIDKEEFERGKAELTLKKDSTELKLRLLEIDNKYSDLSDADFDKQKAILKDEPYVRVAKLETDPSDPAYGGIIFDYNRSFVLHLEEHGYGPHPDSDETVNEWFNELCKNVAMEAFDGLGDFSERVAAAGIKRKTSMSDDVLFREDPKQDDGELPE